MTDLDTLIAEAREHWPALFRAPGSRELIDRRADALESTAAHLREAEAAIAAQNADAIREELAKEPPGGPIDVTPFLGESVTARDLLGAATEDPRTVEQIMTEIRGDRPSPKETP